MAAREIYDFKTDSRRFKTCLKEVEDHFETNGYHLTIICLFFPANMNLWKRQTMVSLIPDSRSVPNLCLWLALALKSVWGVVRGTFGMLGEGNSMYHTALKWLVKLKIRTIEGFWSSFLLWHTFSSGLFSGHFFSADQTHLFELAKPCAFSKNSITLI